MLALHWLTCDGCGASPLRGDRWRCISCTDYDLCETCHDNKIHSHHRFEMIPFQCETHDCYCDGCPGENKDRLLVGPRYICLTHPDKDWCERYVNAGKACAGPFKIEKQTELGFQLERDRCLPMPQEWSRDLRPAVVTYSVDGKGPSPRWFDTHGIYEWFDTPLRQRMTTYVAPKFKTVREEAKGKLGRDGKVTHDIFSIASDGKQIKHYTFLERIDMKHNVATSYTFKSRKGAGTTPKFTNETNENTLEFVDPVTSARYCWVGNQRFSTLKEERYDFQRNALFQIHANGGRTMLVDWTWHDGNDKIVDSALTIRDITVCHALVIASLTTLHSFHWDIIRDKFKANEKGVNEAQWMARLTPLGMQRYWHAMDFGEEAAADAAAPVAVPTKKQGMSKTKKLSSFNGVLKGATVGMGLAGAIVGAQSG